MRKRQKKARLRLMRNSRFNAACDPRISLIQTSLEEISARLGELEGLAKGAEHLDALTKERLAARAHDNLRIENLKKLFRLAYGNDRFVSQAKEDEGVGETLASFRRRMTFMKNTVEKLLNDEGVRTIAPAPNEAVSESEHRILQTVEPNGPEDQAGCIAECLEVGFAVHGVITPAEVTVFSANNQ